MEPVSLLRHYPARTRTAEETREDGAVVSDLTRYGANGAVAFFSFKTNEGTLAQPEGYAVAFTAKTPFVRDPFLTARLAFGTSIFAVVSKHKFTTDAGIPPHMAAATKTLWCSFIPDESTDPPHPINSGPNHPWVAALGAGGSVALLKRDGEPNAQVWYIKVTAGLPAQTETWFLEHAAAMQGGFPDLGKPAYTRSPVSPAAKATTFDDAASTEFANLIKLSEQNRARLAWTAAQLAEFEFVDPAKGFAAAATQIAARFPEPDSAAGPAGPTGAASRTEDEEREIRVKVARALAHLRVPSNFVVPVSYKLPSRPTTAFGDPPTEPLDGLEGFALGREITPRVDAALEIRYAEPAVVKNTWNVLVPAHPSLGLTGIGSVWYSECVPPDDSASASGIVTFDDPTKPIRVFGWGAHPSEFRIVRDTLGAFPNVVPRELGAGLKDLSKEKDFTAYSAMTQLEKHFTNDPDYPPQRSAMVSAKWATQDTHAAWAGTTTASAKGEARFHIVFARHAVRATDRRPNLPTKTEMIFNTDDARESYHPPA